MRLSFSQRSKNVILETILCGDAVFFLQGLLMVVLKFSYHAHHYKFLIN